ncbi:MAG TPA: hypothetical protein VFK86_03240 [Bauldia sp.]|nr:hypothetical protein [Bauldia sp.]
MNRNAIAIGISAALFTVPAMAADILVYEAAPPPSGSPVYAAEPMIAADVGLAIGYFWWDDEEDGVDSDTGEVWGSARVNIPFGAVWNEEIELSGLAGFESDSYYTYGAFSHTYFKNPGSAAGLLLGASSIGGDGALTVGAEGAVFLPTTSFVGLLAYSWGESGLPDFWSAAAEARWYWNPNTKFTGLVSFNDYNSAWMLTAGAEHRFQGTMASIFADATYYTNDVGTGWELFAGGRLFFDKPGQTLQGHDYEVPFAAARAITF